MWKKLRHRWPSALALVLTVDNLVAPRPLAPWTLLVLAFAYLSIGVVRGTLRPGRVLAAQLGGAGVYLGLIALASALSGTASAFVVGAGWFAHAGWDLWHHRRNLVVWREFAEWCAVVDAVIGVSVLMWAVAAL
ncbi:hypothetical protein [Virgisporangium aliadipatigenens]|nr:hypothetical protein [Virgisporangium aliadipatigenens]